MIFTLSRCNCTEYRLGLIGCIFAELKRKLAKVKRLKLLGDPNLALGRLKKRRRFSSLKGPGMCELAHENLGLK